MFIYSVYDISITGVNMRNSAFRAKYCMNINDAHHFNEEEIKYVMPYFERILAEYYQDFLSKIVA